jgi:hypothetical protein
MDQKMFSIVAGVILPLVHRGQRRRVLIAGGNGATVYVAERTAMAGAVAYRERRAIALTPKAVRLRHFARVA